jgi:hypothetical protein
MLCGFKGPGASSTIYVNPRLVRMITVDATTTPEQTRITFDETHHITVDVPVRKVREDLDKEL